MHEKPLELHIFQRMKTMNEKKKTTKKKIIRIIVKDKMYHSKVNAWTVCACAHVLKINRYGVFIFQHFLLNSWRICLRLKNIKKINRRKK